MLIIDMDTKVSASGPGTLCTLSHIAETYNDSLDASVRKVTKFTVKEACDYVEDLTKISKHVADDKYVDAAVMTEFVRGLSSLYEATLTKMRANKKAS